MPIRRRIALGSTAALMAGAGSFLGAGAAGAFSPAQPGFNGGGGGRTAAPIAGPSPGFNGGAFCNFVNDSGQRVWTISPAGPPMGSDQLYWMRYYSGGAYAKTVKFTLTGPSGSPLAKQVQLFHPYSNTSIETPFAIPYWSGKLTSGTYTLQVTTNTRRTATCTVTVS